MYFNNKDLSGLDGYEYNILLKTQVMNDAIYKIYFAQRNFVALANKIEICCSVKLR